MNKKFLLILFFGIFLINLNFASAVLTNATMLNDTFESGNLNLWTDNGATDWVLSITRSVSPTHSVEASKKTNDLLSDNMDMSDATEIYISFSYWITSIDPNDNVYLNYWDGTAYDQIDEIGDDAEGTWLTFSQTITDSQYFNNGFHIYIEGSSIDNRENLWIDDVLIKKQYSANEVPIVSNITSSHETIKGGEIITVYANTTTHGVNDTEQGTLYLYCDTSDVPTSLNTDCAGGSVTTDIDYPYVFTCLISTPLDDSSNTEYCRVYDGEDYSSAVNVTYLTDSSSPTTSVISVAGDSVASYFDISNNGRTDILVSGELNMSCRWSSSDLAYSAMTSVCPISESIANCSVNNVASQGFTTRYVACEDSLGNEQNSTTNLNVGFYLDYTAPVTTDNSNINIQAPPYIVTITESDNVDSDPATYYCTSSSVGCNPTTIIDNGGIVTYTSVNRGVNYLRYYSVDDAGISQTIVNKTININQLPIFNSAVDDAVIIASGATVNVSTVSSEPDAQQLTMYVCSSASATSAGCSDTEYCSASESANVSCTFSASSSSGIYNWYAYIFDDSDEAATANPNAGSYAVDATAPVITVINPENYANYTQTSVSFQIILNEVGNFAWYNFDSNLTNNVTMLNSSTTQWSATVSDLTLGLHNVTFYSNDSYGNVGVSSVIYFSRVSPADTTAPAITILSPQNASYKNPASTLINISADENLAWAGYQLNGGSIVDLGNSTATNWNIILSSLTQETKYNLTIYGNDTSNNQNNKTIIFYSDSLAPRYSSAQANPSPSNVSQEVNCSVTWTDIYNITTVKIAENSAGIYENHTIAFSGVSGSASYLISGSKLTNPGTYECIFYAEDFAGNSNVTSVSFDVNDVTVPVITAISPFNGTTYSVSSILASITISEDASSAWYSLDGEANVSMSNTSGTSWSFNLVGLLDAEHNITFYANDTSNNLGTFTTIYFTVNAIPDDTTPPAVIIISPGNATYNDPSSILVNVTSDENLAWVGYQLNGGSIVNLDNNTAINWNITLSLTNEAEYNLTIYANDTSDNQNNKSIVFYVDSLSPRFTNALASPSPANVSQAVNCSITLTDIYNITTVKISENSAGIYENHTIAFSGVSGVASYNIIGSKLTNTGTYECIFYAEDFAGNSNSTSVSFDINDVTSPLITVTSPSNGATYNQANLTVSITTNENISWAGYSLDGVANISMNEISPTSWDASLTGLSNGAYAIVFSANDSSNNIGASSTISFTIDVAAADTTSPVITINTLSNGTYYTSTTNDLNITTDETTNWAVYKINSGSLTDMSNTTDKKWNITLSSLGIESTNFLEVYANDSVNNTGNTNITFYVDTLVPRATNFSASPNPANVSQNVLCNAYIEDTFGLTSVKIEENASIPGVLVNHTISLSSTGWANYTISNVEKGTYTCRIYATDIAGNNNFSESTTFDVNDVIAPLIIINSPLNQTYSSDSIFIGITTNENVGSVVYSLDVGVTNVSLIGSGTSWSKTSVFLDGSHNITFYVNDSSNNLGYASTVFSVDTTSLDTTFPTITIWSPTNGTYDLDGAILLNISSDEALSWAGWQNGSDSIVDLGNVSTVNWNSTVVFSEGIYNLTFYANDSSSNQNQENSSVVFYVDLTNPSVDYFSCSDANDSGEVICFANVSDVIGLDYAIIGYNATGVFQNSSQISLSGLSDSLNYTIAAGNSSPPGFTTQIYLYDDSGRNNLTESDFVVISDDTFPLIYNVTYSPNTTTDLDPGVRVNINASIVEDYNISSVVFMYKNSSASSWTSIIMSNLTTINYGAETNTIYNASFVPQNETWYFQINATDAAGNQNIFSNYTLVVEDDISFLNSTTIPDTKSITYVQRSENNSLGILYLNNTGDGSLDFNISVVSTISSRFNINYTNDDNASYSISSGDNLSLAILVNTTDLTTNLFYYNLTIVSVLGARTYEKQLNIQTADGPYLVVTIPTYSALVTVGDSNVGYVAKLENFGTQDAQDSYLNWTLPSGFTITSGSENRNLGVIPIGGFGTNTIETSIGGSLGLVNIIATGSATSADSANDTKEITVSALAGTSAVPEVGSSGGGGGGSGFSKGGAESAVYSKTIEIVRGQEDSFEIVIENNFKNMSLQNLELELTGFLSQYISTSPIKIGKINPGESKSFLIKLKIPSYKESYEEHELKAVIKGRVVRSGENSEISYTETQNILLIIQEVSMKESSLSLAEAERAVEDMRKADFNIKDADGLLSLAKNKLYENRNKEAQVLAEEVIEIRDMAFGVDNLIRRVASAVQDPKKSFLLTGNVMNDFRGNDRNVTLKQLISANSLFASDDVSDMLNLAIASFERGDYVMAEERIMDARSLLLLERKGNFGLFFYLYWYFILLVIGFFIIFVFFGYKQYRKSSVTRRIEDINSEEENIRKLMQVSQRNYFLGKSSSGEYHSIMDQHQSKLVNIRKQRLTLRNKRIRMLKSVQIIQELKLERMQVESEIRKLQEIYYRDNKISESEYKAQFEILNERLAEIEGEKITLELLKGKNKNMNKQVVKKSLNKEVIKARKNVVGKGKARIMFLSIWGFLKRPFNRKENILDKKKKIRGVRKK